MRHVCRTHIRFWNYDGVKKLMVKTINGHKCDDLTQKGRRCERAAFYILINARRKQP
jgi:hypothetical protein